MTKGKHMTKPYNLRGTIPTLADLPAAGQLDDAWHVKDQNRIWRWDGATWVEDPSFQGIRFAAPGAVGVGVNRFTWKRLLENLEALEMDLEQMPAETSNAAHFARIELANTMARAREILEALANDEERKR
jgi:hypothetical protein